MDLLRDILASQAAGNANAQNGMDSFYHGAELATNLSKAREENNILASREQSNAQIANGDLIGALRTAQSSGDQQYQNNLMNHINQNRQTLGSIAQNLTNIDPAHRQAALQAANGTLDGLDVDTTSLNNADNDTLRGIANSTIGADDQIRNLLANRKNNIEQEKADTGVYDAQTGRANLGVNQQNANTRQAELGLNQNRLNIDAAHFQNMDNDSAYKNAQRTFTDEDGNTYSYNDTSAPRAIAIPNLQGTTLADRNNNPGNLVYAGQPGARPTASGYASFENPQDGVNANLNQIDRDINVHGYNTIDKFVDHWASTSSPAERRAYKGVIMRGTNKGINDTLTSDDIPKIFPLVAKQEGYSGTINNAPNGIINGSQTKMITLPNGQQVPAILTKAAKRPVQTNQEAKAGINLDMAKAADATLTKDEMNGDIPSKHVVANSLPEWWAMTGLPGSKERGILNQYENAQTHISQEANTLYHPTGGTAFSQKEQDNLVLAKPYDTEDMTNQRTAYRRNIMNDLRVRSQPNGTVTEATLDPGFVDPTTYNATQGNIINPPSAITSQRPVVLPTITRDDVINAKKAFINNDAQTLKQLRQKYGKDQLRNILLPN